MIADTEYLSALEYVLNHGEDRGDRTGTGTRSVFGLNLVFDNSDSFPILTTKRVHFKSVVGELLWMLSGSVNVKELREKYGVTIWDEWEQEDGSIGPGYGKQWRNAWQVDEVMDVHNVDQMQKLIDGIIADPYSRRHIVNAWNVGQIEDMALPPCHTMFQCYVHTDGTLDLQLYQRSSDMFLGLPFNIAQYALLQRIIAELTGKEPGKLHITIGDAHIYSNHFEQVREQLDREPRLSPKLWTGFCGCLDKLKMSDFQLIGYDPHPTIKAPVAI
jgi:thymidylate synthase